GCGLLLRWRRSRACSAHPDCRPRACREVYNCVRFTLLDGCRTQVDPNKWTVIGSHRARWCHSCRRDDRRLYAGNQPNPVDDETQQAVRDFRGTKLSGVMPGSCANCYCLLSFDFSSIKRLVRRTSPRSCVHSDTMFPTTSPHFPSESIFK